MRVLLFLLSGLLFFASCKKDNSSSTTEVPTPANGIQALEAQVMAIHDEVMPKMKDITELSAKLREIKSNVQEDSNGKIVYPDGLDQVSSALKLAEQGMWDWMKAYSDTKATLKEDQLESFYKSQLELVSKVKSDMLSAIEKGQTWLNNYEQAK
jgi:hypothetical protein